MMYAKEIAHSLLPDAKDNAGAEKDGNGGGATGNKVQEQSWGKATEGSQNVDVFPLATPIV